MVFYWRVNDQSVLLKDVLLFMLSKLLILLVSRHSELAICDNYLLTSNILKQGGIGIDNMMTYVYYKKYIYMLYL